MSRLSDTCLFIIGFIIIVLLFIMIRKKRKIRGGSFEVGQMVSIARSSGARTVGTISKIDDRYITVNFITPGDPEPYYKAVPNPHGAASDLIRAIPASAVAAPTTLLDEQLIELFEEYATPNMTDLDRRPFPYPKPFKVDAMRFESRMRKEPEFYSQVKNNLDKMILRYYAPEAKMVTLFKLNGNIVFKGKLVDFSAGSGNPEKEFEILKSLEGKGFPIPKLLSSRVLPAKITEIDRDTGSSTHNWLFYAMEKSGDLIGDKVRIDGTDCNPIWFESIYKALQTLANSGYMHTDLKTNNLVINKNDEAILIDAVSIIEIKNSRGPDFDQSPNNLLKLQLENLIGDLRARLREIPSCTIGIDILSRKLEELQERPRAPVAAAAPPPRPRFEKNQKVLIARSDGSRTKGRVAYISDADVKVVWPNSNDREYKGRMDFDINDPRFLSGPYEFESKIVSLVTADQFIFPIA